MELIKVAEALIEKIKKDYQDDIALVALCGSYIYNDTHDKSDLDFYFIPNTDRGYEMAQCFILEDIGFDFWGMSWKRAESLAKYNEENTSIISEANVIYYSSQDDLEKFNRLRTLGNEIDKTSFYKKSNEQMNKCYDYFFKMIENQDDFSIVKQCAMKILYYASFSTALINKSYVRRGGRNLLKEILAMKLVSSDFEELFIRIVSSNKVSEIISDSQKIILNMRDLIERQREVPDKNLSSAINGYYEELKSIYNKLLHECEIGNQQGIMLAIARLDGDVSSLLEGTQYDYSEFPNLFLASQKFDMPKLIKAINVHEKYLVHILEDEGVQILSYKDFADFCSHLQR